MIHLYYTYSVSKLPYRRAFISATSNREFPPDFLNQKNDPPFIIALEKVKPYTLSVLAEKQAVVQ